MIVLQSIVLLLVAELGVTHADCPAVCNCNTISKLVRCPNSQLTAIPVGLPSDTISLRLEYNQITKLAAGDFSTLPHLRTLYLYNNGINLIEDGAFRGLTSLKRLFLESNNINLITNLTFEGATNLEQLMLRNNRLSSLLSGAFDTVPLLFSLDLANNDLSEFQADLANVRSLDLSENRVSVLQVPNAFEYLTSLQSLKLNRLRRGDTSTPIAIPDTVFNGLTNLTELELDGNDLLEIPRAVRLLRNLISLSLNGNKIQNVRAGDFYTPSRLTYISLAHNSLDEIPVSALAQLPRLTEFYVENNPIFTVPARAFWSNRHLQALSIGFTNLSSIDKEAFVGLDQLSRLWLDNNNLTIIPDDAMDSVNRGVDLWLYRNPFHCDCHIREFVKWLQTNHTGRVEGSPQCLTPERLKDTELSSIQPQQLSCKPLATIPTTSVSAFIGTDTMLHCYIEADPITTLYWITNQHDTVYPDLTYPQFTVLTGNGSLVITDVGPSNQGLYTCEVTNTAGADRSSVMLQVLSEPQATSTLSPSSSGGTLVQDTTIPATTTKTPTPQSSRSTDSVLFGLAGGIMLLVILLLLTAIIVIKKRKHPAKPTKSNIPLPLIPHHTPCHDFINEGWSEDPTYAVIPADQPPPTDTHDYATTLTGLSGQIQHTYFTKFDQSDPPDKTLTACRPDRCPSDSSKKPTPENDDRYMTMKSLPNLNMYSTQ